MSIAHLRGQTLPRETRPAAVEGLGQFKGERSSLWSHWSHRSQWTQWKKLLRLANPDRAQRSDSRNLGLEFYFLGIFPRALIAEIRESKEIS